MKFKMIFLLLVVLIFGLFSMFGVPIEKRFLWIAIISFIVLVSEVLWLVFAFIWILILKKKSYDRYFFWIKPKPNSKRKLKKKENRSKGK